jgi:hypothetical protein
MTASDFANRLEECIGAEPQGSNRQLNAATIHFENHTVTVLGSDSEFNVIFEKNAEHVFSMNVDTDALASFAETIRALADLINQNL